MVRQTYVSGSSTRGALLLQQQGEEILRGLEGGRVPEVGVVAQRMRDADKAGLVANFAIWAWSSAVHTPRYYRCGIVLVGVAVYPFPLYLFQFGAFCMALSSDL